MISRPTPLLLLLSTACCLLSALSSASANPDIERRLKKDVTFLASRECEGRGPNTQGLNRAADHIAAEFKKIGLLPGMKSSYFQPFTIPGAQGTLTLVGPAGQTLELKQQLHFSPLGYDQGGQATAPLVFVGYGLSCKDPAYDDYAGIEVKGKIVVLIRDTPRSTSERSKEMIRGASFQAKLELAQKKGAVGALIVNDADTASHGDTPIDYTFTTLTRGGRHLLSATMRRHFLEAMLSADRTLGSIEKEIDREMKPISFDLQGWTAKLRVERKADMIPLKNVVGVLEGNGPLARETIIVGAHYDHLGYGNPRSMEPGEKRAIHHGADDNASGTAVMIELARRFASMPGRQGRRLVFLAFSGEELGLFGSGHYCRAPIYPLGETAAMFNLDMVGRLRKDDKTGRFRLFTEGHGTAKEFKTLIDNAANMHNFVLSSQESGFGPSDHAAFCAKDIPVLFFWTGKHADYHRPSDTTDRLNVEGMRQVAEMSEYVVTVLTKMNKPEFIKVKGTAMGRPSSGPRLGIRPGNYDAGETRGVEVEGVSVGGPAEKAGLKDGDIIIEIAGRSIQNINTYMQAMALQKQGTKIDIVVLRAKKKMTIKVELD